MDYVPSCGYTLWQDRKKRKRTFFKYGPKNNWKLDLDKNNRTKIEDAFKNEMIELGYL